MVAATEVASLPKALRQPPCTDLLLWFQMTTHHPITPPPELVTDWCGQLARENDYGPTCVYDIATQAARWGADQELEACCKLLELSDSNARDFLTSARRPKPPSLKEQALAALSEADQGLNKSEWQQRSNTIRRALEQLDD